MHSPCSWIHLWVCPCLQPQITFLCCKVQDCKGLHYCMNAARYINIKPSVIWEGKTLYFVIYIYTLGKLIARALKLYGPLCFLLQCSGEFFTYLRSSGRFDEQTTVRKNDRRKEHQMYLWSLVHCCDHFKYPLLTALSKSFQNYVIAYVMLTILGLIHGIHM